MPQTNRMNLRYPAGTDTPDVVRDMGFLAADLEAVLPRMLGASFQAGVIGLNDLKVSAGAGMTVNVAAGVATVPDQTDTYPALTPVFRAALNGLVVTAANGTNPRLDQVLIDPDGALSVLAGTPTAGATLDNRNGNAAVPVGYLRLADVLVPAASVSVAAGNIRDRRPFARGALARALYASSYNTGSANWQWIGQQVGGSPHPMAMRLECSGAPMRAMFTANYVDGTAGWGDAFTVSMDTYGSLTPSYIDGMQWNYVRPVAGGKNVPFVEHTWQPSAGSHIIEPYFYLASGGGAVNVVAPMTLVVEEKVQQFGPNTF